MKRFTAMLTIAALAAVLPVFRVDAAGPRTSNTDPGAAVSPLPAGVYPPHTKITYHPTWSNHDFDCNFGWYCDHEPPMPFVHILTEDQLHRTGGWATWGEWHGDELGFELYLSTYADGIAGGSMPHPGVPWNQAAALDEQTMLVRVQKARAAAVPAMLPDGVTGEAFAYYLALPYGHVLFLTAWWGATHEVEAAVLFPLSEKAEARRYLIKQVYLTVQLAETDA
jgi:hypothetical protein